MTRILWDQVGERFFETGVDRGVLYLPTNGVYDRGYAWNGLTSVTESPSGAEPSPQYADNMKYLNLMSTEEFNATVEAFTYPEQFAQCDGTAFIQPGVAIGQQNRKTFGLSYRTKLGNDVNPDLGYKIHLVYGALAAPSEKSYNTVNESPEATPFSWEMSTTAVPVTGFKPTAILTIPSTSVPAANLAALENAIYGTVGTDPRLPLPDEIGGMFAGALTTVTPADPTFVSSTGVITIPTVTGVTYRVDGVVRTGTWTIPAGSVSVVKATPNATYRFPDVVQDTWVFRRP